MQRAFSLRRYRSTARADIKTDVIPEDPEKESILPAKSPGLYHSLSKRILRRRNTRPKSYAYGDSKAKDKLDFPHRTLTRREKIIHVIANPDTLFIHKEQPYSRRCESRFNPNDSAILRTFFAPHIDFAPTHPTVYVTRQTSLPTPPPDFSLEPDSPIFNPSLLPASVLEDVPLGYIMRPMARSDKDKGFLEVLRGTGKVGYVSNKRWDERCEYLYKRAELNDEYILVIVDVASDKVVGVGRWVAERGFMNNLATNGRIEDIAVAKDVKGMKLGLRILEALVHVSVEAGCHKTTVNCSEANEAFHGQIGFVKDGSVMIMQHQSPGSRKGDILTEMS